MVLTEDALNLLPRVRNSFSKDPLSFEYLLCTKRSSNVSYPFLYSFQNHTISLLKLLVQNSRAPLSKETCNSQLHHNQTTDFYYSLLTSISIIPTIAPCYGYK